MKNKTRFALLLIIFVIGNLIRKDVYEKIELSLFFLVIISIANFFKSLEQE